MKNVNNDKSFGNCIRMDAELGASHEMRSGYDLI